MRTTIEAVFTDIATSLPPVAGLSFDALATDPKLAEDLEQVRLFGSQTLLECPPADWDTLRKVGYFPFAEASTDIEYAILLALVGTYKLAYHSLRSFLELAIVGVYFISEASTENDAARWLSGELITPFMSDVRRKLLKLPSFASAEAHLGFDALVSSCYSRISDRTHTRGTPHGHAAMSKSNRPRFIEESLRAFATDAKQVCEVTAIALAIQRPIVLIGLPMWEKFGMNPPMSGYLEQMEAENLRSFIAPERLRWLDRVAHADENTQSTIEWVESRPDLTREELDEQVKQHNEWLRSMQTKPTDNETG